MHDRTIRRDDLAVGRRAGRVVIGRAATGALPLFLDVDEARWLALVALPALELAPTIRLDPPTTPAPSEPEPSPIEEPSAHLAPTAPALF